MPPFHGLLVLDKPGGITSRAAVDRALRWFPRGSRLGHTGTLDPLATGVLVLALGAATRLTEYVQRMPKTYRAGLLLGARSDTDDADGTVTPVVGVTLPDAAAVSACLAGFLGSVTQVPPAYSAAKVSGRRSYDLARQGRAVPLEARTVEIYGIDLLAWAPPRLELEVRCGKGTYIRSLARDLGERLGCGGLVETLRRTRVGPFTPDQAVPLEADAARVRACLLPAAAALAELPRVTLSAAEAARLARGQGLPLPPGLPLAADGAEPVEVAVLDPDDRLVAVAAWCPRRRLLQPVRVLAE